MEFRDRRVVHWKHIFLEQVELGVGKLVGWKKEVWIDKGNASQK